MSVYKEILNGYGSDLTLDGITGFSIISNNSQCAIKTQQALSNIWCATFHKSFSIVDSGDGYLDSMIVRTNETIDLTEYNEIVIQGIADNNYTNALTTGVYVTLDAPKLPQANVDYDWSEWTECMVTTSQKVFFETHIDITRLSGNHYLFFGVYHGTQTPAYNSIGRISKISLIGTDPRNSEMSGADAAAIAWCIARTQEQAISMAEQKKAYKEGLKKGIEGGADITEEYEQGNTNLDITTDEDGNISSPFIGRFVDGIYYTDPTGAYVHMWLDMSWTETLSDGTVKTGRMVYDAYDAEGTLIDTAYSIGSGGWAWKMNKYDTHVVSVAINGSTVKCVHTQLGGLYRHDWSPTGSSAASIMKNAVKVGNIPPEIIN